MFDKLQRQLSRLGLGPQAAKGLAMALALALVLALGYFISRFFAKKEDASPAPPAPEPTPEPDKKEDKEEVRMAPCHKQGCDATCPDGGLCNPFAPTGDGCICHHAQCPATQL